MRLVRCDCCGLQADSYEGFRNFKINKKEDGSYVSIDACSLCRSEIDKAMKTAMYETINTINARYEKYVKLVKLETDKV